MTFRTAIDYITKRITLYLLMLCLPFLSMGQACCSGGTPLSGSLGLNHQLGGTWSLGVLYDYNTQHHLVAGNMPLSDNPRRRTTQAVLARVGYAFNDKWSMTGLLSTVRQDETTERIAGGSSLKRAEGVGDAVLFGQYSLVNNLRHTILLGGGAEIPLGSTLEQDSETGLPLHPDLQPGRGAWSFLGGVKAMAYGGIRPTTSWSVQMTYRYARPAGRYEGLQTYKFGNEIRLLAGISDRFDLRAFFLDPSLLVLYRHTQVDLVNGNPSPNTGGHWWHLRPSVQWVFSPQFQVSTFVEFPLFWQLEGTQLTTSLRGRVSVQYALAGG